MKTVDHYTMQSALKKRIPSSKNRVNCRQEEGVFFCDIDERNQGLCTPPLVETPCHPVCDRTATFIVFKGRSCLFGSEAIAGSTATRSAQAVIITHLSGTEQRDPVMFRTQKKAQFKKELMEMFVQDQ
jgi:hypothetical protein